MNISQKILSDLTVYMKYAKHLPKENRRESWEEIVTRNMNMHIKKYPAIKQEIEQAYKFVYNKTVLPSMRSMQFGGKPIEISPNRIYNCAFLPVDSIECFSETMFLLLGGTGVGYSVQKHHVEKLPEIRKPSSTRTRRFLVGDSIEGWADSIKHLFKSYFGGVSTTPIFDFSDIRPKGALLVTSGGKAPGPQPLKDCIYNIRKILDSKEDGDKLQPIEAHDIICYIADAVLAGGIRRAALISLFSADDYDMLSCKSGTWWEQNPQRGRANNSVVLLRHRITEEFFKDLWKRVEASGSGEPGIYFTNDKDWGTNPCCEIALRPYQFCVAGDTKLITKNGIDTIKNYVGKDIRIWNGEKWSTVKPYITGDNDRLHRVWFSDGSYLDATDNHKFLVKNRFQKEFSEVETIDLIELLKNSKYQLQVPRSNIVYNDGTTNRHAYDYGFILGDGFVYGKNNIYAEANLYNDDKKLKFNTAKVIGEYNNYNNKPFTTIRFGVDNNFAYDLKYEKGLPGDIFTWDKSSILNFIAGWADADGSQASNGIRIYGSEDKIRDGQLLLSKIGINSSVNLSETKGTKTNLSIRKKDLWYLQITITHEIPTQRLICNNSKQNNGKSKNQIIKRIDTLDGLHSSYCLTENEKHQCVFNNVLTKQCNLCEVNVSDVETQEELNERVKAAAFIGTLQAGYTDFHYLRDVWKRTTEKDALIGVSMTGIGSGKVLNLNMKEAAKIVKETNELVALLIGINKAARTTTVKPSGTASLVLGTSSGIHSWYNDYYIRRIRVGKNESIYTYLTIYHPELLEDDYFRPHDTAIINVPQRAPEGSILRSESPLNLLRRIKKITQEWVKPGHRSGANSHNISATINLKPNEWKEVGEWMWNSRDFYNGLSVLPYDTGTYVQTPFEDCTQEIYEEMLNHLHNLDLSKVVEMTDETNLSGELACSGSQGCEVK